MDALLYFNRKPMNAKILDYTTLFIAAINGMFAFIQNTDINLITAWFGLGFIILRNLRFTFVLLYEIGLFLFYKTHRARIVKSWRREMKSTQEKEKETAESEQTPPDEPAKKVKT